MDDNQGERGNSDDRKLASEKEPPPEWRHDFTHAATIQIVCEAFYLLLIGVTASTLLLLVWWSPGTLHVEGLAGEFRLYAVAGLAGFLGGTAFAIKWLHHSVGNGPYNETNDMGWHASRFLWRFFVPLLSGLMAYIFYALIDSGFIGLDITSTDEAYAAGVGFIIGYFSDRAGAKLSDVAYVLFGRKDELDPMGK